MVVEDAMSRNPIVITVSESIDEAEKRMFESDIRHLPVVDVDGNLVGIVSDRDVRSYLLSSDEALSYPDKARDRRDRPVSEIMQGEPLTIEVDADLDEASEQMLTNKVGALPVVEPNSGRLIGILSYVDLLRLARFA